MPKASSKMSRAEWLEKLNAEKPGTQILWPVSTTSPLDRDDFKRWTAHADRIQGKPKELNAELVQVPSARFPSLALSRAPSHTVGAVPFWLDLLTTRPEYGDSALELIDTETGDVVQAYPPVMYTRDAVRCDRCRNHGKRCILIGWSEPDGITGQYPSSGPNGEEEEIISDACLECLVAGRSCKGVNGLILHGPQRDEVIRGHQPRRVEEIIPLSGRYRHRARPVPASPSTASRAKSTTSQASITTMVVHNTLTASPASNRKRAGSDSLETPPRKLLPLESAPNGTITNGTSTPSKRSDNVTNGIASSGRPVPPADTATGPANGAHSQAIAVRSKALEVIPASSPRSTPTSGISASETNRSSAAKVAETPGVTNKNSSSTTRLENPQTSSTPKESGTSATPSSTIAGGPAPSQAKQTLSRTTYAQLAWPILKPASEYSLDDDPVHKHRKQSTAAVTVPGFRVQFQHADESPIHMWPHNARQLGLVRWIPPADFVMPSGPTVLCVKDPVTQELELVMPAFAYERPGLGCSECKAKNIPCVQVNYLGPSAVTGQYPNESSIDPLTSACLGCRRFTYRGLQAYQRCNASSVFLCGPKSGKRLAMEELDHVALRAIFSDMSRVERSLATKLQQDKASKNQKVQARSRHQMLRSSKKPVSNHAPSMSGGIESGAATISDPSSTVVSMAATPEDDAQEDLMAGASLPSTGIAETIASGESSMEQAQQLAPSVHTPLSPQSVHGRASTPADDSSRRPTDGQHHATENLQQLLTPISLRATTSAASTSSQVTQEGAHGTVSAAQPAPRISRVVSSMRADASRAAAAAGPAQPAADLTQLLIQSGTNLKSALDTVTHLTAENSELKRAKRALAADLARVEEAKQQAEQLLEETRRALEVAEDNARGRPQSVTTNEQERAGIEKDVASLKHMNRTLRDELRESQVAFEAEVVKVTQAEGQKADLEARLRAAETARDAARAELEVQKRESQAAIARLAAELGRVRSELRAEARSQSRPSVGQSAETPGPSRSRVGDAWGVIDLSLSDEE